MSTRTLSSIHLASRHQVAPGLFVRRPLPDHNLKNLDPYLMLDHFGPIEIKPDSPSLVPDHPHSGFHPVTLLFRGRGEHKDSVGNHIILRSGDVGWMTAGRGIVHSELFGSDPDDPEHLAHGVQLWVNTPAKHKMSEPGYRHIKADDMPVITGEGYTIKLVAGSLEGNNGLAEPFSPITIGIVQAKAGSTVELPVPEAWTAGLYQLQGDVSVNGRPLEEHHLGVLEDGDHISYKAETDTHQLLLLGQPLQEPVASYGPFVMTNMRQVIDAIEDYNTGKMGRIEG